MSETGITFDVIAIGLAALGVLVACAMHVIHLSRGGTDRLAGADSRAATQSSVLLKSPDRMLLQRFAAVICIAALIGILGYAFAHKIHLI